MIKKILWYIIPIVVITMIYLPIMYITKEAFSGQGIISPITENETLKDAITVSLVTSIVATFIGVIIATLAALGLTSYRKVTREAIREATKLPLTYPDIVLALGLMSLFLIIFGRGNFGYTSLILAHLSFTTAYAFVAIYPKAKKIGKFYGEASSDLGATPLQTLIKVILPNLKTAIIGGAAIAFAMSFDDYIISKLSGGLLQNISGYLMDSKKLYTRLPGIYAITALMFLLLLTGVVIYIIIELTKKRKKVN